MLESFGLDGERLQHRIEFLFWRAKEHQQEAVQLKDRPESDLRFERRRHWAAAATCFRDAAMLALALGDQEYAQNLLNEAGHTAIAAELLSGYLYFELARNGQGEPWWVAQPGRLEALSQEVERIDVDAVDDEAEEEDDVVELVEDERSLIWHWSNPDEVLNLYKSLLLDPDGKTDLLLCSLRKILKIRTKGTTSKNGIPLDEYLVVLDYLVLSRDMTPAHQAFLRILVLRQERLRIAQLDTFHWQSFLVPFDLIDLDIAFLGALDTNNVLLDWAKNFDELTLLSIRRGKLLFPQPTSPSVGHDPPPEFDGPNL